MIKSKWRKYLCYAIILALVGGALIIGILAAGRMKTEDWSLFHKNLIFNFHFAAGVILTSEPTPIEQRNFNDDPVKAGIFGGSGGLQPSKNNSAAIPTESPTIVMPSLRGNSENDRFYGNNWKWFYFKNRTLDMIIIWILVYFHSSEYFRRSDENYQSRLYWGI